MLPIQSEISIVLLKDFKLQTIWLFLLLSLVIFLFTLWNEAKKDGFDLYKIFDFTFTSILLQVGFYFLLGFLFEKIQFYTNFFVLWSINPSIYIGFMMFLFQFFLTVFFSNRSKWSIFRLLDLMLVSSLYSLLTVLLGLFLLTAHNFYVYILLFVLVSAICGAIFRNSHLFSGFVFSAVLLLAVVVTYPYFTNVFYLPIYLILLTMSLLTIYFRRKIMAHTRNSRSSQIMMVKTGLLNSLKQRLLSKEKKLKKENDLFVSEDPYLKKGRAEDNAETIDDAILEDAVKESVDNSVSVVSRTLMGVRRALARIKLGRYGVCEMCGNSIENARLRAYPEATTCVTCAQKHDK